MPRKYAVLHQFVVDLDRLLTEAESAFSNLQQAATPAQPEILALFRPIHSLKGICGMVEDSKLLVRAFHLFEDALPPLLPVRSAKNPPKSNWIPAGEATFKMAREVEQIIRMKLDLWKRLGADENESRGLVVSFLNGGTEEKVWIPITGLVGLATREKSGPAVAFATVGDSAGCVEYLLIGEVAEGIIALNFTSILSSGTRLDAVQGGVPYSFKEWWSAYQKKSGQTRARRAA